MEMAIAADYTAPEAGIAVDSNGGAGNLTLSYHWRSAFVTCPR